jgi:hypothetical protein
VSKKPGVTTVQDANTGELYLLYDLDVAAWPGGGAPKLVYECSVCKGRFPPEEWKSGCPGCAKKAKEKAEEKSHKKKWTLTED